MTMLTCRQKLMLSIAEFHEANRRFKMKVLLSLGLVPIVNLAKVLSSKSLKETDLLPQKCPLASLERQSTIPFAHQLAALKKY